MNTEEEYRGRSRSRSFMVEEEEEEEVEKKPADKNRTRTRSRSFSGSGADDGMRDRRRSRSFVSSECGSDEEVEMTQVEKIARAASLSKMYMAGSQPVDVKKIKKKKERKVQAPSGALSAKALDALSDGLQQNVKVNVEMVTKEEMEEIINSENKEEGFVVEEKKKQSSLVDRAASFKSRFSFGRKKKSEEGKSFTAKSIVKQSSSLENEVVKKKKHKLKLLLLGDSGVGKTSLIRIFSGDTFSDSMLATAGVDFKLREMQIETEVVSLQIWDTAGQERFHRITATYYKGAHAIILVYDVNDKKGFDNVGYWMNNIQQYSSPNLPAMLLVGNKIDLPNRVIPPESGQLAAQKYHCRFLETSAKTSQNCDDALHTIVADALYLSLNAGMTQEQLLEKEKAQGSLKGDNCSIS